MGLAVRHGMGELAALRDAAAALSLRKVRRVALARSCVAA